MIASAPHLDRLVDERRRHLARLQQVAGQLDLVALGDALGKVEHCRGRLVFAGQLVGQLVAPIDLDDVDRDELGRDRLGELAAKGDDELVGRPAVEAEDGLSKRQRGVCCQPFAREG